MLFAALVLPVGSLYATDQATALEQSHQYYARVVDPQFTPNPDFKVSPKDYPNGVYIQVQKGGLFSKPTRYDKVEAILVEKFKQQGFRIAETRETADATASAFSSIDFSEIQESKNNKLARGLSIADDVVGILANAKLSGGQSLIVNGINVQIHKKKHWALFSLIRANGQELNGGINVVADYSEDTPVVSAALLGLMFDEWAKKHVTVSQDVISPNPAGVQSNSAASPVVVTANK